MQQRKLVEQILVASYKQRYLYVKEYEPESMGSFLYRHDSHTPVWRSMDDNTKQAAITYVYKNRKKIELHSGCVPAWVQATAYFMIYEWFYSFTENGDDFTEVSDGYEFEIESFFDDMDFLSAKKTNNDAVRSMLGISKDFNEPF